MLRKKRKVVLLPGLCDGCGKCAEACEKINSKRKKRGKRSRKKISLIRILKKNALYFPVICRNCEDAPCVTACMSGCRKQTENGIVLTDYSRCVGCWMCIMNCPFGAIVKDEEEHIARKCEGCSYKEIAPCVGVCKRGILSHVDVEEFTAHMRKNAAVRFLSAGAGGFER